MITLNKQGVYLIAGRELVQADPQSTELRQCLQKNGLAHDTSAVDPARATKGTMASAILDAHSSASDPARLSIRFDALASHDITYVGIIQSVRAVGLDRFPVPYALTNCHNSLCAVGGTINEDDHVFGLSAAKKYGGIFVPPHYAVIHQYVREALTGCGRMVLGSDSHTRYGPLGTMGVGEGGPEIAKQLLSETYDLVRPETVCVYLKGKPRRGVGPHDVAIALIGAVFTQGFVTNRVLEFVGPGIAELSMDYRNGIDVMSTEMGALSSIWITDSTVQDFYREHGRPEEFRVLAPAAIAWYARSIVVDLDQVEPMIALPFHPSKAFTIREFLANAADLLAAVEQEGKALMPHNAQSINLRSKLGPRGFKVDQGIIAGCAGGLFDNIVEAATIIEASAASAADTDYNPLSLAVYPGSQPIFQALSAGGSVTQLMQRGAVVKTAFCGPCFGAGDTPENNGFSIRHTTRNFENREGSKPGEGQLSFVALMDARSIAATYGNGGWLKAADELDYVSPRSVYHFDDSSYRRRVYQGALKPMADEALCFGPNIADWPDMPALADDLLLRATSVITDPVTTTDELIPSGETSSYRSNPYRLAEFTLSRKDPAYVGRAKATQALETARSNGQSPAELTAVFNILAKSGALPLDFDPTAALSQCRAGSVIVAVKPGDGSAREQAASCQKVLGGGANIARGYATARYRSNLINWGMLPLIASPEVADPAVGDWIWIPGVRAALEAGADQLDAFVVSPTTVRAVRYSFGGLDATQRTILLAGCQINHYRQERAKV